MCTLYCDRCLAYQLLPQVEDMVDGKSINYEWHTGWNVQGDYTEETTSNRADSPSYQKRVFARSGADGSYSEWVPSGRTSLAHKDFVPYKTDLYDARFY